MTLSRREFLQSLGLTAAGAAAFGIGLPEAISSGQASTLPAPPQIIQGRVLQPTHVYNLRSSAPVRPLLPNTVVPIHAENPLYYGTDGGSIMRREVQPMQPYSMEASPPGDFPFLAEVSAPTAAMHPYADPTAPPQARIGHGGVLRATDAIENRYGRWYALESADGELVGWSQALHWRSLPERGGRRARVAQRLRIDRGEQQIIAYTNDEPVLMTAARVPLDLPLGIFPLEGAGAIGHSIETHHGQQYAPYRFRVGEHSLHGVTWHNKFGLHAGAPPSDAVEVNVLAAKWLWLWAGDGTIVEIM